MFIVDAHTHWFPEFISSAPHDWGLQNKEEHWANLMAPRADGKANMQGFPSIDKFLKDMDSAGIDRAVIQSWYWKNSGNCSALNKELAKAIKRHADRLSAFMALNPKEKNFEDVLDEGLNLGFLGVGELHDGVQGFSFGSDNFFALCETCADEKIPICAHLTDDGGKKYPNKILTDNKGAFAAASIFPKTKFIFAHWGGGEIFKPDFIPLKNVFYDCAASPLLYGKEVFATIKPELAEKIIYGSDYPLNLYPKHSEAEEMSRFLADAKNSLSPHLSADFFSGNYLLLY